MASTTAPPSQRERPILFHYPGSIYSYRILWYLWLRGIEYDECVCIPNHHLTPHHPVPQTKPPTQIQPPIMPRPDLTSLSISYRRMPLLALGRDIYVDSRQILRKLESHYPASPHTPLTPASHGLAALFESYSTAAVFNHCVNLMPYWSPASALSSEAFVADRARLAGGRRMTADVMQRGRPEAMQYMRLVFGMFEGMFLADGRRWILGEGEEGPSTADIDAMWPLAWLLHDRSMAGSLPVALFNREIYPRTFAWVDRFMALVAARKTQSTTPPVSLGGAAMKARVLASTAPLESTRVDDADPLAFKAGDVVEVYPSDYGQAHRDRGTLVGLTVGEVVVRNEVGLHLHFPRWGFRVVKVGLEGAKL